MIADRLRDAAPDLPPEPISPDRVRQFLADRDANAEIARVVLPIKKRKTVE